MSIEQFLIKKNITKDEKGAQKIMIGIIALCVLFFIIKGFNGNNNSNQAELSQEEIELLEQTTNPEEFALDSLDPNFR